MSHLLPAADKPKRNTAREDFAVEMPLVTGCTVEECAYNRDRDCHALAITVGDTLHAGCDTFFRSPSKGGDPSATGRVGACKMSDCRHNIQFECCAPEISVGHQHTDVDCLTYTPA